MPETNIYDESIVVTTQDLRTCLFCAKGTRNLCRDRGYDWLRFVHSGLPWPEFKIRDELENALYRAALERSRDNGECESRAAKGYDKADLFNKGE